MKKIFNGKKRMPMKAIFKNSLRHSMLSKKVYESKIIDDMESPKDWIMEGIGKISFTKERSIDGSASMRFQTPIRDEEHIKKVRTMRTWPTSIAILKFKEPQDWSRYNRLSLWIYVHPSSVGYHSLTISFDCEGIIHEQLTSPFYSNVVQYMEPGKWNHVLWEIPHLRRDKVTEFRIRQSLCGDSREVDGMVIYDIDRIELQRVDETKYEGWEIAPGKIAFSHIGYKPGQVKTAIAGGLAGPEFQVVNTRGKVVLTGNIKSVTNERGKFQLLDFTKLREPGEYFIRSGKCVTRSFKISKNVWDQTIGKILNFYYCMRCGYDVPGVHGACHSDWFGVHQDKKLHINGGWYDAGDLSQGYFRTAKAEYAMMEFVRQLALRGTGSKLRERIVEEALWGLDYILKTRFGDGYRITFSASSVYTDNKIGTYDDIVTPATNIPWENFLAAALESLVYKVLKNKKPKLAKECLRCAEEDWEEAVRLKNEWLKTPGYAYYDQWLKYKEDPYLALSWGIISSINLYKATGDSRYAKTSIEYGKILMRCQEKQFIKGIPLTGFFYTGPGKESLLHYVHFGFEEAPIIALMSLCRTFPEHEDWINWYGAVVLHSEYFIKSGAKYTSPYYMLINSIYRKEEILKVPDNNVREAMLTQLQQGTKLTDEYFLRYFPIWTTYIHHGSTAIQLSKTRALTSAIQLRNDLAGEELAYMQMNWIFGANPFCQTLMYGEGYDYSSLYAPSFGDIVGSIPVGMDCIRNDKPFWPDTNYACFKEIWIVPVSLFLWNMAYLSMSAYVEGKVEGDMNRVSFCNKRTGLSKSVNLSQRKTFKTTLPSGEYTVEFGSAKRKIDLVSGGNYKLTLNPEHYIEIDAYIKNQDTNESTVRIEVNVQGRGTHNLNIRIFNANVNDPEKKIELGKGTKKSIYWDLKVTEINTPWVAVIIPDNDLTWKKELLGTM